ncbi:MAG: T9SS type A sorting domain-containing protein [Saprospiraceae bacterium]
MSWESNDILVLASSLEKVTGESDFESTPLTGCINPGDPECNGVCESGDSPSGPDCNGVCGAGDSSSGPDCNGVCGAGDSSSGPDCNGVCGAGDSSSGPDCNGACDASDSSSGPDCNGTCDPSDSSSGPDCNGSCDLGEVSASSDCDGFCNTLTDHPFSVDCSPPLPAELVFFKASVVDCSVALSWETASELNVSHFTIERKVEDDFQVVGTIAGKGDIQALSSYEFEDPSPVGQNIYRLVTYDFDGTKAYSNLVSARLNCQFNPVRVFPNPAQEKLSITGLTTQMEVTSIRVLSMSTGALVSLLVVENDNTVSLDLTGLPVGVYLLQVKQNESLTNHRFVKQ